MSLKRVLVLGGGPDAEHEVSLNSSAAVAQALNEGGRFTAHREVIGALTPDELRALPGDVVFPVLHGPWGEGGPLQRVLEVDGRPFVGCGSRAARAAMDKLQTKQVALALGIETRPAAVLHPLDDQPPIALPLVLKPVHEGSSVGLALCSTMDQWHAGVRRARESLASGATAAFMVEPLARGRELTVGVVGNYAMPIVEITPADGVYDYAAKYTREDTRYVVDPPLPQGMADAMQRDALRLAGALGCLMLARVDFLLDERLGLLVLEVNTMPGFTDHSLLPMAAAHAGLTMPDLCARLVSEAIYRHGAHQPDPALVRSQ